MHVYAYHGDRGRAVGLLAFLAVILAIGANAAFAWLHIGPPWLVGAPTVAAAYGILYGILEQWGWRWQLLRWLGIITTPIVAGHYEGELVSSYNQTRLPISIDVEQVWTRLIVRFAVASPATSESLSMAASLNDIGQHCARLTYTYRNTVRPGVAEPDMNDHDGTAELTINTADGTASGRYYNYRGRQGTLQLTKRDIG